MTRYTKVSLYRVKNGNHEVWLLRWHADGKRHSQTLGMARDLSKREAEALRREKEIAFGSGREQPKRVEKITLAEFAKRDREAIQATVRPSTLLEYDHAMRHTTAALGDDFPIGRITRTEVGRIRNRMANPADPKVKPRSPATIRKTLKTLGTMMRRAV